MASKRNAKILVVDDEMEMCRMLQRMLGREGYSVIVANDGMEAMKMVREWHPDCVVSDVKMVGMDGITLLKNILQDEPALSVILITGYGTIEMAVEAVKAGAYDFIEKPFDKTKILFAVKRGVERAMLLRENVRLSMSANEEDDDFGIIGESSAIARVRSLIRQIADCRETVLVRGESGTGKELAARAIHRLSSRGRRPLVTVNCPALPEHILESELFGYVKGAFTGADQQRKGLFLDADRSSILLDEIGDLPVTIQTKLLRVLQEKEIRPLGSNRNIKVDVRIISSTNRNLEEMIAEGSFREDLFFRLNVITVKMPALREIREDIPLLASSFLEKYSKKYEKEGLFFSDDALDLLMSREWKGNVRELKNLINRAVLLNRTGTIRASDLDDESGFLSSVHPEIVASSLFSMPYSQAKQEVISSFSVRYIKRLLARTSGNVSEAARICGMERQGLQRLLRRYGINPSEFRPT